MVKCFDSFIYENNYTSKISIKQALGLFQSTSLTVRFDAIHNYVSMPKFHKIWVTNMCLWYRDTHTDAVSSISANCGCNTSLRRVKYLF